MEWAEQARSLIFSYGPDVVAAAVILAAGYVVARIIRGLARRLMERGRLEVTVASFTANLLFMALMAFVVIASIEKLGVNTTSFAAVVAAAGLAIGLALQGSLANFAAGFLIIILQPFKVGDYIEAAGIAGTVEAINVFATELCTPDNKAIIVPNSSIISNNIVNYSARARRRIDLVFSVGYGDDLKRAKELLEVIVAADPRVLEDPAPVVAVSELGSSSVDFVVRPWVATDDYWQVRWDLIERVKLELDAHGITIPFPQRDVHLYPTDSAA